MIDCMNISFNINNSTHSCFTGPALFTMELSTAMQNNISIMHTCITILACQSYYYKCCVLSHKIHGHSPTKQLASIAGLGMHGNVHTDLSILIVWTKHYFYTSRMFTLLIYSLMYFIT